VRRGKEICSKAVMPERSRRHKSSSTAAIPLVRSRSSASAIRGTHSTMKELSGTLSASASRTERPSDDSFPMTRIRFAFTLVRQLRDRAAPTEQADNEQHDGHD
jgi:hypothetical protein